MKFYHLFMFIASLFLISCDNSRVYETNIDINQLNWDPKDTLRFDFVIEDNNQEYNLFYTLRYTNEYPFYNLFTKYFLLDSAGRTLLSPKVPDDMYLFNVKTGTPYGTGIGDIYDQKISFLKNEKFPYQGKFSLKVVQYMRDKPLPGIASFGIRIEKNQAPSK